MNNKSGTIFLIILLLMTLVLSSALLTIKYYQFSHNTLRHVVMNEQKQILILSVLDFGKVIAQENYDLILKNKTSHLVELILDSYTGCIELNPQGNTITAKASLIFNDKILKEVTCTVKKNPEGEFITQDFQC